MAYDLLYIDYVCGVWFALYVPTGGGPHDGEESTGRLVIVVGCWQGKRNSTAALSPLSAPYYSNGSGVFMSLRNTVS